MLSKINGVSFRALMALTLLCIVQVSVSFNCWMRRGGETSFALCDQKKEKQPCSKDLTRCGTFSYTNKTGFRIYAKSCTSTDLCSANGTFCSAVEGLKDCRVQCCDTDLCNFEVGFASTLAPTITQQPTTTQQPKTAKEITTTQRPTTKEQAVSTPSAQPTETDDEDCSWVDSAACPGISSVTVVLCFSFLYLAIFL